MKMTVFLTRAMIAFLTIINLCAVTANTWAYEAPFAAQAPTIDGTDNDSAWQRAKWEAIDQLILGAAPTKDDFSGRFKVVWTAQKLYLLAEITDDILIDTHSNPLNQYWEDDTLEVFLDEDTSGGHHLDSYNAFAYHIALDNQVVDYNTSSQPRLFNDHVTSVWKRNPDAPNTVIWEASFNVYPDTFSDLDNMPEPSQLASASQSVGPVTLTPGKNLGFMVAYCDSDGPDGRQHFIGSHDIEPVNGDKNRGYIDASVFDTLTLVSQ